MATINTLAGINAYRAQAASLPCNSEKMTGRRLPADEPVTITPQFLPFSVILAAKMATVPLKRSLVPAPGKSAAFCF